MQTAKRLLSLLLTVVTVFATALVMPLTSSASDGVCGENLTWKFDDYTGELTISGTGEMYPYYTEEIRWRDFPDKVVTVTIEDGMTGIGDQAFYNCTKLESVTIPNSVTSIGSEAFRECKSLKSITIPNSVTSIERNMFFNCKNLRNVNLPDSITSIGDYAFYGCEALTRITILDSVKSIGRWAFYNCKSLTDVTIPNGVTSIGDGAFQGCSLLTDITIPDSVTAVGKDVFKNTAVFNDASNWTDDVLYIGNHLIASKTTLSGDYAVREGTKTVAGNAFNGCSSLNSVTIPNSVKGIGDSAFYNCRALTDITIPEGVTNIGKETFYGCKALTDVTLPDGMKGIGDSAFENCSELTNITMPDSVTGIGEQAFFNCKKLKSVTIPKGVTTVAKEAFFKCSALESVTIPEGVKTICTNAFQDCFALAGVTLPKSVMYIESGVFKNCTAIKSIDVHIDNKYFSSVVGVLFNKNRTELITYPAGKEGTSYAVPSDVKSIGVGAFWKCLSLKSISLPYGVTKIGNNAFAYSENLTSVTVPISVNDIGSYAFLMCPKATIKGYTDSYAQTYANDNSIPFTAVSCDASHNFGEWTETLAPTCTEAGLKQRECTKCHEIESGVIAALGHDYEAEWTVDKEPTADEPGSKSHHCKRCGDKGDITFIPATGSLCEDGAHAYGDWVTDREATCTASGRKYRECEKCHDVESEDIPALGHDYETEWTVDKKPAIGVAGSKSHHCKVCGEKTDVTEIPALVAVTEMFKDVIPGEWYVDEVQYAVDNGLFFGVSDNEFAPEMPMNRAMLVTVLWRMEGKPTSSAENKFTDVPANEWYTNAVIWASENGVVFGTSDTEFSPEDEITREQMAAILFRYATKKRYDVSARTNIGVFPDNLDASKYARPALSWACGAGLIYGSEGKLLPQDGATRAQVAAILMRFRQKIVPKWDQP